MVLLICKTLCIYKEELETQKKKHISVKKVKTGEKKVKQGKSPKEGIF